MAPEEEEEEEEDDDDDEEVCRVNSQALLLMSLVL